jgi:hypothetical protein
VEHSVEKKADESLRLIEIVSHWELRSYFVATHRFSLWALDYEAADPAVQVGYLFVRQTVIHTFITASSCECLLRILIRSIRFRNYLFM